MVDDTFGTGDVDGVGGADSVPSRTAATPRDDERADQLEARLEALSTLTEAMFSLLAEQGGPSIEALRARIEATARDRAARRNTRVQRPKCQMAGPPSRDTCMYCGAALPESAERSPFD